LTEYVQGVGALDLLDPLPNGVIVDFERFLSANRPRTERNDNVHKNFTFHKRRFTPHVS
jgi:hypothetical protein